MSLPIARLITAGFEGLKPPPALLNLIATGLGGVILFARNIESPRQLLELIAALKKAAAPRPLVVSIDQEGGRVARLRGAPWAAVPPMRVFGTLPRDEAERCIAALGALLAAELAAVGIDLDFAPVLDVDTNPANPVIGDRAFSRDPEVVAALGAMFITALQAGGVAACGKHFPGHGDTDLDSHLDLPIVRHDRARLDRVELLPFHAAVDAGVAAIMSAHVVCEAFDAALPATLSSRTLGCLRTDLGFGGAIIGDDFEMRAIADRWPLETAAPMAIGAGIDQLLICRSLELVPQACAAIATAVDAGRLPEARVREAIAHWDALAARFAHPPPTAAGLAWLDSPAHATLVRDALSRWAADERG